MKANDDGELLARAREAMKDESLRLLLGPAQGAVQAGSTALFAPASGPLVWFDGATFHASPVELDPPGKGYRFVTGERPLDERLLYWAGEHMWSLLQRYGNVVLLQESTYFTDRREALPTLHVVVDAKTPEWAARIVTAFVESRKASHARVDPFVHEKRVLVRLYHDRRFGERPRLNDRIPGMWEMFTSHGVQGDALVSAGWQPGVMRLRMAASPAPKLTLVERFADPSAAAAAFETAELDRLAKGWTIDSIVALPVREIEVPFRLRAENVGSRATIEELRALRGSKDPAKEKDAEDRIVAMADPVVDAWVLSEVKLAGSAARFGRRSGFSGRRTVRNADAVPLQYLQGSVSFDSGRIGTLIKRGDPDDARIRELRSVRNLVVGAGRLNGRWKTPIRLDEIDAYPDLELLVVDAHGDVGFSAPRTRIEELLHLCGLRSLWGLVVYGAESVDVSSLAAAPSLKHLELVESRVSGLPALERLPLETLVLTGVDADEADGAVGAGERSGGALGSLPPSLERLVIDGGSVALEVPLSRLPRLRSLELHTARGTLAEVDACRSLGIVDLRGCPWVSELEGLDELARSSVLHALALDGTPVLPDALSPALTDVVTYAEQPDLGPIARSRIGRENPRHGGRTYP